MKGSSVTLFVIIPIIISCHEDIKPDDSISLQGVVASSTYPADGSPSLANLSSIGLINLTSPQAVYEVAIANTVPPPDSLPELQSIVDAANDQYSTNFQSSFGITLAGPEFGNTYPGVHNTDYIYPASEQLDYYQAKGLHLIRLPFSWERVQPELNGVLDLEELTRIKNFVHFAASRSMFVLLDLHNFGRYNLNGQTEIIGSNNLDISHVKDLWTKLAFAFKDNSGIWGYGIMNEPHDMLLNAPWFEIAQEIIIGIRAQDKHTKILVGGDNWSSAEKWVQSSDDLKNLIDPAANLVFEAHVYFDKNSSGRYKKSYDNEGAYPTIGIDRVQPFLNWLQTNNLKGFVGEYGVPGNDQRWLTALDNLLVHLKTNCINGCYWAGGPWWGDYNLSIEPHKGIDRIQMGVVQHHTLADNP